MAITSKLATAESTLANEMVAGELTLSTVSEAVSSTISMGQTIQVEVSLALSHVMTIAHVASFISEPTPPAIPLVINEGVVQQNSSPMDSGPSVARTIFDDFTSLAVDQVIIADKATPLTLTLIAAASFGRKRLEIKNIGVGTLTIDPDGVEMIDNLSTANLSQWEALTIFSTGSGWIIL